MRKELRGRAGKTIAAFAGSLNHYPSALPQMLVALDFSLTKPKQVIIAGKPDATDTRELLQETRRHYLPNTVVLLADGGEGQKFLAGKLGGDEGNEAGRWESGGLRLRELHLQSAGHFGRGTAQAADSLGAML